MILKKMIGSFTLFELWLWLGSMTLITVSFLMMSAEDYLTLAASLIGVTALICCAKGYVSGQIQIIVFSVFYGVISFYFRYYGEMITYLGMTTPIAVMTMIEWIRHPFGKSAEVTVSRMTKRKLWAMIALTAVVTTVFYFILDVLENTNLFFSTVSVATSFIAGYLTLMRSPYYALGYAANDIVLVVLWVLAAMEERGYFSMVICFVLFLVNDIYGFVNWKRMQRRQEETVN
ncbi:MAG: nicotinamide mononucleotide transporter [Christensenellaceae bacterium]|nr:nicotinamide mononucleotide transporter [Christensenellaceae bacterium]